MVRKLSSFSFDMLLTKKIWIQSLKVVHFRYDKKNKSKTYLAPFLMMDTSTGLFSTYTDDALRVALGATRTSGTDMSFDSKTQWAACEVIQGVLFFQHIASHWQKTERSNT